MATREYGQRSIRWRLAGAQWGPFTGGLNTRDSYTEIAANELSGASNMTLDERGVATKVNNSPASASFPAPPGAVIAAFYSNALSLGFIQVGTTLYKCAIGGGSWTSVHAFSTSYPLAMVDFLGDLNGTHGVDGAWTYDGATFSGPRGPVAATIAVWQNKLWFGQAPIASSANSRVYFTPAGSEIWGSDFIDLREKDNKSIVALYPASGLLVLKENSAYRIYDSTVGAYQTIDWNTGARNINSVAGSDGRVYLNALDGLYEGDGSGPFTNIGDKLKPIWQGAAYGSPSLSVLNGRLYVACDTDTTTTGTSIIEYNPRVGWLMKNDLATNAIGPWLSYSVGGQQRLSFASYTTSGSVAQIQDLQTSTTRTGFPFSISTGYVEPFGGRLGRLGRLTFAAFGTASTTVTVSINYISLSGTPQTWTSSFSLGAGTGIQRPILRPQLQGSAFQLSLSDPNNIASFSLQSVDMDFVLSSLR